MNMKNFLKLVEIPTKVASLIPLLLGSLYVMYHFKSFDSINFMLMLVALLCIDMATTALNNFYDYKRALKKYGYNYETHNAIVSGSLKEGVVITIIFFLVLIASIVGLILVWRTNILVLLIGGIAFMIAYLYSAGPVPISRTFLGEIVSGVTMGFGITFLAVYIHIIDLGLITFSMDDWHQVVVSTDLKELLSIILLSVPVILTTANIMLANNICDMEDDLENKRYTLPIYIGKDKGLKLYKLLYLLSFIDVLVMALLRITPPISLTILLIAIPVYINIDEFVKLQSKKDTFIYSIYSFLMINLVLILSFAINLIN
ncbi:1,4-dihydroxy-2-naphthoate polyprenyltransferase [Vallitalea okinawensis]|uniref:1,4-dihydroxy-2-naphthoate polyprenyltransferase n=1 Tax=Vallitalea okinawensis TaxID=2078660 RepID=UPI000CFBD3F2|nr:1,4-dihydroxy-2-naphthoate polyprenyltransferase [Vallitalea okinawensis]